MGIGVYLWAGVWQGKASGWAGGRAGRAGSDSLAGWAAQRGSCAVYAIHQALSKY